MLRSVSSVALHGIAPILLILAGCGSSPHAQNAERGADRTPPSVAEASSAETGEAGDHSYVLDTSVAGRFGALKRAPEWGAPEAIALGSNYSDEVLVRVPGFPNLTAVVRVGQSGDVRATVVSESGREQPVETVHLSSLGPNFSPSAWIAGPASQLYLIGSYGDSGAAIELLLEPIGTDREPTGWQLVPKVLFIDERLDGATSLIPVHEQKYAAISSDREVILFDVVKGRVVVDPIYVRGGFRLEPAGWDSPSAEDTYGLFVLGVAPPGTHIEPEIQAVLLFEGSETPQLREAAIRKSRDAFDIQRY